MSPIMVLIYLVIQFIVQLALYISIKEHLLWGCFHLWKTFDVSIETSAKILSFLLFGTNMLISILVKVFTSSGGLTGMTNLGASVLVGLFMAYDVYMFKRILNNNCKK